VPAGRAHRLRRRDRHRDVYRGMGRHTLYTAALDFLALLAPHWCGPLRLRLRLHPAPPGGPQLALGVPLLLRPLPLPGHAGALPPKGGLAILEWPTGGQRHRGCARACLRTRPRCASPAPPLALHLPGWGASQRGPLTASARAPAPAPARCQRGGLRCLRSLRLRLQCQCQQRGPALPDARQAPQEGSPLRRSPSSASSRPSPPPPTPTASARPSAPPCWALPRPPTSPAPPPSFSLPHPPPLPQGPPPSPGALPGPGPQSVPRAAQPPAHRECGAPLGRTLSGSHTLSFTFSHAHTISCSHCLVLTLRQAHTFSGANFLRRTLS